MIEAANAAQDVYDNPSSFLPAECPVNSDISIFPNPTENILNINWDQSNIEDIQIFDCQGKLMQVHNSFDAQNVELPMKQLAKGVYILSIKNQIGQFFNYRIVKI